MLEQIEEAFDEVAFAVEREIAGPLDLAVGLGRDDRNDSPLRESADEPVSIVRLVGKQGIWLGVLDQQLGTSKIMGLAWRKDQLDGIAQGVDEHVNFGGQSAA